MQPVWSYSTDPEVALLGSFDVESRLERVPRTYTLKGMFFSPLLSSLGSQDWDRVRAELVAPPRAGRYLAFADYPQVDYCRLALAAAERLHPDVALPEAARRLARRDFTVFAESRLGKVLIGLAGDLPTVLCALPTLYDKVTRGGRVSAERLDGGGVRLEYRDYHGWVDCYTLGTLEGVVMHFGRRPRVQVGLASEVDATYEVRWE